jgi:hypothetical protein
MKPNRAISLACLIALAPVALFFSCASLDGGDATETGNALISGKIIDSLGFGVQAVRVQILPCSHDPVRDGALPDSLTGITDESGWFSIRTPGDGIYNIEAIHPASGYRALVKAISAIGRKTVVAPAATMQKPGTIGALLPSQYTGAAAYVYLPGTTRFGRFSGNAAIIDSVPAGSYPALCYSNRSDTTQNRTIHAPCTVTSAATTYIADNQAWNFSVKFYFNTTSSGAAVSGNVYSFPVLIRLSAGSIDFSKAKSDGSDVLFTKSNNRLLPYEIESWDAARQTAAIWVKVDTVFGNDTAQYIEMYYGNAAAANASGGATVFDTAGGFQGVWHLAEPASGPVRDATPNHYDGTPMDTAPAPAPGVIGTARRFNGTSHGIRMKGTAGGSLNFPENGRYSVSAWVYSDTLDDKWHCIVGKSNGQYFLKQQIASRNGNWEFVEYHDKSGWQITETPVTVKTWKYLTGVRDGDKQYLYLDGQLVNSTIKPNYDSLPRTASDDVTIGRFQTFVKYENEGLCFFDGKIDEVRISSVARSADWIKLCFMNQREDDRLAVFKKVK